MDPTRPILFAVALAAAVSSQEIPGLRAALRAPAIVRADGDVQLQLVLQVEADTRLPAQLVNGRNFQVRVDGAPGAPIQDPGSGGELPALAGTRIERPIVLSMAQILPAGPPREVAIVSLAWQGLAGVDCTFEVVPGGKSVDLDALDLARTEVVLVTNHGDMRLSLRPDKAPRHAANFVKLCLDGFYDGTKFHRVIRNFMIQGGCPKTRDDQKQQEWGSGGPGYTIDAEFNDLRHLRGTLSMARTSDPNSAGSGFFIVHKDSPHLDEKYSAFGNLVSGADVLDSIAAVPVGGPQQSQPLSPVVLRAAIVVPKLK